MKSAGLSSKFKRMQRETTKRVAYANTQTLHFGALEKQKSLRIQAEAIFQRQKKETQALTEESQPVRDR